MRERKVDDDAAAIRSFNGKSERSLLLGFLDSTRHIVA
jgi:hypothetical protein